MSASINLFYLMGLCVFGWRLIYRVTARTRGEGAPSDALLWVSGAVLVLMPVVGNANNATVWNDPETLDPTLLSIGGIIGLLAWDGRAAWSLAHRRTPTTSSAS